MVGLLVTGHGHGKSAHGHGRGSQWSAAMVGVVGGASGCSPRLLHSHAAGPARPCQACIVLCVCIVHSCSHHIGDAMCLDFGTLELWNSWISESDVQGLGFLYVIH